MLNVSDAVGSASVFAAPGDIIRLELFSFGSAISVNDLAKSSAGAAGFVRDLGGAIFRIQI